VVEIQEYAVGAQPGDTNSTALRPSIVRENVGHALDTVMTRNQEPRQVIIHHGPADEVVVAGAPNSEKKPWPCGIKKIPHGPFSCGKRNAHLQNPPKNGQIALLLPTNSLIYSKFVSQKFETSQ